MCFLSLLLSPSSELAFCLYFRRLVADAELHPVSYNHAFMFAGGPGDILGTKRTKKNGEIFRQSIFALTRKSRERSRADALRPGY